MKISYSKLSLAQKLTLLALAISIIGSLAVIILTYFSIANLNEKILADELSTYKIIQSRSYTEPLWNFDRKQIVEISDSFLKNGGFLDVVALKVVDSSGEIQFNSDSAANFKNKADMTFSKIIEVEIKKNGESLGKVFSVVSTSEIMDQYRKKLSSVFLYAFLIIGFSIIWIYLFFNKLLTIPLNKLLKHVDQVKHENYLPASYDLESFELNLITKALNHTSHIINKRNEELRNYTENLEKMVDERTRELESQIMTNINASRLVAVGELASGIAHEINNPLTIINGQVTKLRRLNKGKIEEEIMDEPLHKILLMSDRIVKIVNGLKLISRNGEADPMKEFSMVKMLEEILLVAEMRIKSAHVKLTVDRDPNIDLVIGREVQISQVLVNLINNAVDAIAHLEIKWISIKIYKVDQFIYFTVTDSGNGIPKELHEKIMQPFFTTKEVGKGTGLGLSISKGIIQDHGGEFTYNANEKNTQFMFTIKAQGENAS